MCMFNVLLLYYKYLANLTPKGSRYWLTNVEKQALPIQVLLQVIYKYHLTMAVAVLVQENVKLNFVDDS